MENPDQPEQTNFCKCDHVQVLELFSSIIINYNYLLHSMYLAFTADVVRM